MDKKLLLDIFHIPAQSGKEDEMRDFITKFLQKEEIPYFIDSMGNVYNITCTTRPLLNAHMDTVQSDADGMLQKFTRFYGDQFLKGYGIIGADDKCGIYIILQLLKTNEFNFLFTVQEEAGLVGSSYFIQNENIKHIPYGLTFDRCGSSDILCVDNDYGIQKFEDALFAIGKKFGYRPARGLVSDADNINEQISTCNLSVGYYGHHTKEEFVDIQELENAVQYSQAILDNINERFEAPEKTFFYNGYHRYYDGQESGGYSYADFKADELERLTTPSSDELFCFITGKYSEKLVYIDALKHYVSPEGARILYQSLEESDLIYTMYELENQERYDEELENDYERAMEERAMEER